MIKLSIGYIDEKEIKGLVCWVDKELGLSKEVKTMYYALDIPDHRTGISWEEVTKLFDTSAVTSQWLESLNRIKKFIIDELEGNVAILLKNINIYFFNISKINFVELKI